MKKLLSVLLFLTLTSSFVNSQWIQTSGPNTQYVYSLLMSGNSLFTATSNGIYVTSDNGLNWFQRNNGLITGNNSYYCIISSGNSLMCGSDSGIFISTNNGESWTEKSTGLPSGYDRRIKALLIYNNSKIFAATGKGTYLTTNYGQQWTSRNTGMANEPIYSFTIKDNYIFAGSDMKVFRSSNVGVSWDSLTNGFPNIHSSASSLVSTGSNIIVGMCCGVGAYISRNNGERWEQVNGMTANAFINYGNKIIAGANEGVLVSSDSGSTWIEHNQGLQYLTTTALAYNSIKFFAGIEHFVWHRQIDELISVKNISAELPVDFKLYQNYPNPFNPATKIKFDISESAGMVDPISSLVIFNSLGQYIETLVNQKLSTGTYEIEWNTGDRNYPSGIYFYSLYSGSNIIDTKKMFLLK